MYHRSARLDCSWLRNPWLMDNWVDGLQLQPFINNGKPRLRKTSPHKRILASDRCRQRLEQARTERNPKEAGVAADVRAALTAIGVVVGLFARVD